MGLAAEKVELLKRLEILIEADGWGGTECGLERLAAKAAAGPARRDTPDAVTGGVDKARSFGRPSGASSESSSESSSVSEHSDLVHAENMD